MGRLESIVYKPEGAVSPPDGYARLPLQEARLVVGCGIDGDIKGLSLTRQLNVMNAEAVHKLAAEGFTAGPGQLGEQLMLSGVDVDKLAAGARVRIGETACIEVTEPRTGCGKFERYQGKAREEAAGRLGVMARVIADGVIRIGDPAHIVQESAGS